MSMRTPLLAVLSLALAACGKKAGPPAFPPTEVSIVTVNPAPVVDSVELTGAVQGYRTVQVRSQVSGVIIARPFREGSQVKAGEVLFRIDPTTYDADYRSAQAQAADAEARLANAESNASRLRPLLADNAVSQQDVDNAESAVKQARAALDAARANADAARKNLSESTVRAEIAGRVGRALLDVGTRVTGPGDVLTTLDVLDPVYVSFRPSSEQQLAWRRDADTRKALQPGGSARIEAVFGGGTTVPTQGKTD